MTKFIATKTTITTFDLAYQFVDELFRFYGLVMGKNGAIMEDGS